MSFKARVIKVAIKLTPRILILWIANLKLKGIAKLRDFSLDIEARRAYIQAVLFGEEETIEVLLEGFAIARYGESYYLIIQQAQANRTWLSNLLSRIVGKHWKIPVVPQLAPHMELICELFGAEA